MHLSHYERYTFLKHYLLSSVIQLLPSVEQLLDDFENRFVQTLLALNARSLFDCRRGGADRSGLCQGSQGFRPRAGRVQVREGGSGRSRTDLSKGSLLGGRANLSCGGWRPTEEADAVAREADQEIGEQRVSFLFRVTASLPCVGHAATSARRHWETVRRRLRIKSVRR